MFCCETQEEGAKEVMAKQASLTGIDLRQYEIKTDNKDWKDVLSKGAPGAKRYSTSCGLYFSKILE